jgi:fengycin family lipopeptide synthetase B
MRLQGKIALVTGAGRGIGRAIALGLAGEGSDLVLAARTGGQVRETAAAARKLGVSALPLTADISVEKDVQAAVRKAIAEFGRIDILVNNAGILPETARVPIAEVSAEDWQKVLDINLKGVFLFTRAVLPIMKKQNGGYIVSVSSIMGRWGFTNLCAPYTAAKFGICGLMEALDKEVKGTGIKVSSVCPGIVDTDFQSPARREAANPAEWLRPEDVAEAVVFLLTRPPQVMIPEILIYPRVQFPQGKYY